MHKIVRVAASLSGPVCSVFAQAQVRKLSEQVHELKSALVDRDLEVRCVDRACGPPLTLTTCTPQILNVKDAHANDIARFRETLRQKNSELARCVLDAPFPTALTPSPIPCLRSASAQRHGDALKRDEQDIIFSGLPSLRSCYSPGRRVTQSDRCPCREPPVEVEARRIDGESRFRANS